MKYCELPFEKMHIFPNGDVRVCSWTYQAIGNILTDSIDDVWHSVQAEAVRESIRDGSFCCCNHQSCPYLSNDLLPDLSDEEFIRKTTVVDEPIQFNAAHDFVCNHACPSCRHEIFVPDVEYLKNVETITNKLLPVMNKAKFISTDGNGDCFASPSIMKMLEMLNIEDKNCEITLETNGALCDEKHLSKIKHLFEYNLSVIVTPNSFERNTFKYLSGGQDNLDCVISNLQLLKQLRKENKIKNFEISIVVQDTNYRELPEFTRRCIKEFECDRVVIKPIYYWFELTKEEYWFKDILNPKHPYFNEYMKILQDPIFDHEKVFFWGGKNVIHEEVDHPAMVYKLYFDTFARIYKNENPDEVVMNAIKKMGYDKIAIYGVNDMAEMLINLTKKTTLEIVGVVDKYAKVDTFCGYTVYKQENFKPDICELMIISNFAFKTNIEKDLRFWNYEGIIIGINELFN